MEAAGFALLPSVGTWLAPRPRPLAALDARPTAVSEAHEVPWFLQPSVGTWRLALPLRLATAKQDKAEAPGRAACQDKALLEDAAPVSQGPELVELRAAAPPAKDVAPLEDVPLDEEEPQISRPPSSAASPATAASPPRLGDGEGSPPRPLSSGAEGRGKDPVPGAQAAEKAAEPLPQHHGSPRSPAEAAARFATPRKPAELPESRSPTVGTASSDSKSERQQKASPSKGVRRSLKSLTDVDSQISVKLENFFCDQTLTRQLEQTVRSSSGGMASPSEILDQQHPRVRPFRVRVPKPYPGVQYRRSKNLEDRYQRFAQNGSVVAGQMEDNGEWLRISGDIFIPMKVGSVRIVEPLPCGTDDATGQPPAECNNQECGTDQCAVQ